ncbi:MAG: hypothetical protein GYB67_13170 [Chloroflexi bacterium]|nr:hypothetical protein [Chloroflexota bacterium]
MIKPNFVLPTQKSALETTLKSAAQAPRVRSARFTGLARAPQRPPWRKRSLIQRHDRRAALGTLAHKATMPRSLRSAPRGRLIPGAAPLMRLASSKLPIGTGVLLGRDGFPGAPR